MSHRVQAKLTRNQAEAAVEALEVFVAAWPDDEKAAAALRKLDAALAKRENDREDA